MRLAGSEGIVRADEQLRRAEYMHEMAHQRRVEHEIVVIEASCRRLRLLESRTQRRQGAPAMREPRQERGENAAAMAEGDAQPGKFAQRAAGDERGRREPGVDRKAE